MADGTWWTGREEALEAWVKVCNECEEKQIRAESNVERIKNNTFSFTITYMIAPKSLHAALKALYELMPTLSVSKTHLPHFPCVFCPAITTWAFSRDKAHFPTLNALVYVSSSAPTSSVWQSLPHSLSMKTLQMLLSPTSTHHTQQVEVTVFSLSLSSSFSYLLCHVNICCGSKSLTYSS